MPPAKARPHAASRVSLASAVASRQPPEAEKKPSMKKKVRSPDAICATPTLAPGDMDSPNEVPLPFVGKLDSDVSAGKIGLPVDSAVYVRLARKKSTVDLDGSPVVLKKKSIRRRQRSSSTSHVNKFLSDLGGGDSDESASRGTPRGSEAPTALPSPDSSSRRPTASMSGSGSDALTAAAAAAIAAATKSLGRSPSESKPVSQYVSDDGQNDPRTRSPSRSISPHRSRPTRASRLPAGGRGSAAIGRCSSVARAEVGASSSTTSAAPSAPSGSSLPTLPTQPTTPTLPTLPPSPAAAPGEAAAAGAEARGAAREASSSPRSGEDQASDEEGMRMRGTVTPNWRKVYKTSRPSSSPDRKLSKEVAGSEGDSFANFELPAFSSSETASLGGPDRWPALELPHTPAVNALVYGSGSRSLTFLDVAQSIIDELALEMTSRQDELTFIKDCLNVPQEQLEMPCGLMTKESTLASIQKSFAHNPSIIAQGGQSQWRTSWIRGAMRSLRCPATASGSDRPPSITPTMPSGVAPPSGGGMAQTKSCLERHVMFKTRSGSAEQEPSPTPESPFHSMSSQQELASAPSTAPSSPTSAQRRRSSATFRQRRWWMSPEVREPKKICPWMGEAVPRWPTKVTDDVAAKLEKMLISDFHFWDFDIFRFAEIASGRPLQFIGYEAFCRGSCFSEFPIKPERACAFFREVESLYGQSEKVPFHNNLHASDVTQTVFALLMDIGVFQFFDPMDTMGTILAAVVHDLGHDGRTNGFHLAMQDELALTYNDKSVLENFHISQAFKLFSNRPETNLLEGLTTEQRGVIRKEIISMVLGTDMAFHFHVVSDFQLAIARNQRDPMLWHEDEKAMDLFRTMVLHAADLSNPAKGLRVSQQWSDRCLQEFFAQGDEERKLGLPVTPVCDRRTVNIPGSQVGFIELVVHPTFSALTSFSPRIEAICLQGLEVTKKGWLSRKDALEKEKERNRI